MAKQDNGQGGTYLYAVIAGAGNHGYGPIGIDDGLVYCISRGAVAAVVSALTQRPLRPQRRHLAAHHRVLKRLMDDGSPMPMSFGIIADGPEDIRRILALNQEILLEGLQRVSGRVEMGLRVRWDVPNVFEYLVERHEDLRVMRDRAFRQAQEPTREEQIELGRLVERLLNEDRAALAERVEQALRLCCIEIKENKMRDEREIVSLACLIERDAADAFAQGVVKAAALFDANYCFDYNGPWAPHNFVDVNLQM
jgi:hypothetical protein